MTADRGVNSGVYRLSMFPFPKPRMTRKSSIFSKPAKKYWVFKDALRLAAYGEFLEDLGDILRAEFKVRMPKSWSEKKKAEFEGKPHMQRPDLSNFLKALEDCLYFEDSIIHEIRIRKTWSGCGGIEVGGDLPPLDTSSLRKYTFGLNPFPKPRMTKRSSIISGVANAYWGYKDALTGRAKKLGFDGAGGVLKSKFIVPMPKSWSKKKKSEFEGKPHMQRPDLSNFLKALEDCLYKEDSIIHEIDIKKRWGYEGKIIVWA